MGKLFEFLQENNGCLSTARLIPVVVTLSIVFKYVLQAIQTGNSNFTVEEITLLLGSFGIKVGQKTIEVKPGDVSNANDKKG